MVSEIARLQKLLLNSKVREDKYKEEIGELTRQLEVAKTKNAYLQTQAGESKQRNVELCE